MVTRIRLLLPYDNCGVKVCRPHLSVKTDSAVRPDTFGPLVGSFLRDALILYDDPRTLEMA